MAASPVRWEQTSLANLHCKISVLSPIIAEASHCGNLTVRRFRFISLILLCRLYLCGMADRKIRNGLTALSQQMLWGSLGAVYRRYGSELHCAKRDLHDPVFYLTRNEDGHTRNIYVLPELHEEVAAG
jgi:hypothetical protein